MGDTRSVHLVIPAPDAWITDPWVHWSLYDEADRQLASGLLELHRHTTLLEGLHQATAAARRHLRSAYR